MGSQKDIGIRESLVNKLEYIVKEITQNSIACKRVIFFSPQDEDIFFEWVKSIAYIVDVKGRGDTIYLFTASRRIKKEEIQSLISLFRRYNLDTSELDFLMTKSNEEWIEYCKHGTSMNMYPNSPAN